MKKGLTDITIVLDRSGSMKDVREDTIGGFNSFIEAQQKLPGDCVASLIQFDDEYETVYAGKPLKEVPLLTQVTFVPRGWTALLDAIGRTINATGARLAALSEDLRPEKVIVAILTDGVENASKEFRGDEGRKRVFQMIGHQRYFYQWDFVFIGANQDAIQTAASLNISPQSSMTYAASAAGTQSAFRSVSNYMANTRSAAGAAAGASAFTEEDRDEQTKAGGAVDPNTSR